VELRTIHQDELIEEILAFLRRVGVEEAILYGSRARGEELKSSDVDLIVISPRFEGTRFVDRIGPLLGEWPCGLPPLEVLAYTPEEFERVRHGFGIERTADREGVRVELRDDANGIVLTKPENVPTGGKRMLDKTRDWLRESETQKRAAEAMAEAGIHSQAVFHARQAVELALKAATLQLDREEPPRTHSLVRLAAQICADLPAEIREALQKLDPYYIMTRYPTDLVPNPTTYFSDRDAASVMATMSVVLEWIGERLLDSDASADGDASGSESADADRDDEADQDG